LRLRRLLPICLVALVLAACGGPTTKVLFIGNSFTYYNGGIDSQLNRLAPSCHTASVALPGFTLEMHWSNGGALRAIEKGGWQYVVLQEQSQAPVVDHAKFLEYSRRFDQAIRKIGAQTILLMTWERPDSVGYGVTTDNLAAAFEATGKQLGVKVTPVGTAFAAALRERPDLVLYSEDGHPTPYGTYLAACVVYATIFERTPVGNVSADGSIPADLRGFFARIAAQSLGY
jgi:hypothetical protein